MEAYNEIKERHDFITKEREDLIEAKESLIKTIEEIDIVAKKSFLSSFEKIKDNFKTVFRSLFTEDDDCDLIINDEENPLESSIEIMAKPKGKKPLTINQLSGGEKTLTATSLLFATALNLNQTENFVPVSCVPPDHRLLQFLLKMVENPIH